MHGYSSALAVFFTLVGSLYPVNGLLLSRGVGVVLGVVVRVGNSSVASGLDLLPERLLELFSIFVSPVKVHDKFHHGLRQDFTEVELPEDVHEVGQVDHTYSLMARVRHSLELESSLDEYKRDAVLLELLQHFVEGVSMLAGNQVLRLLASDERHGLLILEVAEALFEEADLALVIIQQEGRNVLLLD
eukprot:CAMPEP_0170498170 /NCGR_PEP_ID=MMETSP0208-20121228/27035_1 /TAXON_ID=197538 /ORGANISM="Strombidium inclinatum, Strain S3" /LENGTH=187 /DNA_ID=CAMNT_0010775265 /DNA_START=385 /DNA_END=948 /DNA_ORIENTATION=-